MRRTLLLVTAGALMAAMMVASAMPAFADVPPNPNANCQGENISSVNANHNAGGTDGGMIHGPSVSGVAKSEPGYVGQVMGEGASSDCQF